MGTMPAKPPANRLPADRLPADRLPADRLPADRLPADRLPADRLPIATPEMIRPWRAGYLARARHRVFLARLARAREAIRAFYALTENHPEPGGEPLVSRVMWSAGKDSTALIHLAADTVGPERVHAASEKDDMDFPGERAYVEHVAALLGVRLDIIEPEGSLWDGLEGVDVTEEMHARGTAFSDAHFYGLLERYHAEHGVRAILLGLRAEESRGRRMNAATRGTLYRKADGTYVGCPLADWQGQDVMAYLVSRDVPVLDVYFKTHLAPARGPGGARPEDIRKSWILPGAAAARLGKAAWLRYHYPALYARLYRTNPEIGRFT